MTARVAYLDASALVKLAVKEPESRALGAYLATMEHRVSSRVSVVELLRAATRHGPRARARVAAVLEALEVIELDPELATTAGTIQPSLLRSLDAIHLASAAAMASSLAAVVTYDARLSDAARSLGLPVAAPS